LSGPLDVPPRVRLCPSLPLAHRWTLGVFLIVVRLNELFGWRRNNFDRLVHLSYGLCFGPVLFRRFRAAGRSIRWSALVAVDLVLSTSAVYELFEWAIAMTLAPGAAEAYNGQQGDMWDAQKDMSLATGGAVVAVAIVAVVAYRSFRARRNKPQAPPTG
jgi:putative membrane protein